MHVRLQLRSGSCSIKETFWFWFCCCPSHFKYMFYDMNYLSINHKRMSCYLKRVRLNTILCSSVNWIWTSSSRPTVVCRCALSWQPQRSDSHRRLQCRVLTCKYHHFHASTHRPSRGNALRASQHYTLAHHRVPKLCLRDCSVARCANTAWTSEWFVPATQSWLSTFELLFFAAHI